MLDNEKLSFENLRNLCQELIQRKATLEGNKTTIASHDPILTGHNLLILRNGDRAMDIVTEIDKLGKEDPTVALANISEIVVSGKYVNNSRRSDLWNKLDRIVSKTELISQHTVDLIHSYDATINDDIKISEDRLRRILELEQLLESTKMEFKTKQLDFAANLDDFKKKLMEFIIKSYENKEYSENQATKQFLHELAVIMGLNQETIQKNTNESVTKAEQETTAQTQTPKKETTTNIELPPDDLEKFREFIIKKTEKCIEERRLKGKKIDVGYLGGLFRTHKLHHGEHNQMKYAIIEELCVLYKNRHKTDNN